MDFRNDFGSKFMGTLPGNAKIGETRYKYLNHKDKFFTLPINSIL